MKSSKVQWISLAVWSGIVAAGVVACGSRSGDSAAAQETPASGFTALAKPADVSPSATAE